MPITKAVRETFGVEYVAGNGKRLTLLWNNRGIRAAERLGFGQPGIGDATQQSLLVYAAMLPCQEEATLDDVDDLIDLERSKGRMEQLMLAVVEARKKADPDFAAKVAAIKQGAESADPTPPAS